MIDWLMQWLAHVQGGIIRTLAAELRAGGFGTAGLAFALGALHALTPGHGKAALAAYFLGREAHIGKGLRVALTAALLHVATGLGAFLVLRLALKQMSLMTGRASPSFTVLGYALIVIAGLLMIVQSLRPGLAHDDHGHTLVAGIGLLPCPLTISVLGFAWAQGSAAMVALVLMSLALGISLIIGAVAVLAIVARRSLGTMLCKRLSDLERWGRLAQGFAGTLIVTIGVYALGRLTL